MTQRFKTESSKQDNVIRLAPLATKRQTTEPQVVAAGYMPEKREWVRSGFDIWALGFVVEGVGRYRMADGPEHVVGPGSLFAVFPGSTFYYGPADHGYWSEYYVAVTGRGARRWIERGWLPTDGSVHTLNNPTVMIQLFRELLHLLRHDHAGDADRTGLVAERIALEAYYGRTSLQQALTPTPSMAAVLTYCQQHFRQPVSFQTLAQRNGMSYSFLRQRLRHLTGLAPAQYLARLRCDEARRLLAETDLPIKQIAAHVGFPDIFSFSRTYRRIAGVSPRVHRQQLSPWLLRVDQNAGT